MKTLTIEDIRNGGVNPYKVTNEDRVARYNVFFRASDDEVAAFWDAPAEWLETTYPTANVYGPQFREIEQILDVAVEKATDSTIWIQILTEYDQYIMSSSDRARLNKHIVRSALEAVGRKNFVAKVADTDKFQKIVTTVGSDVGFHLADVLSACAAFDLIGKSAHLVHNNFVEQVKIWNRTLHLPPTFGYVRYVTTDGTMSDGWRI